MSGLGEEIGEAYDDLIEALSDLSKADDLIASVRSGAEMTLPKGVNSREDYVKTLEQDRLDVLESIVESGVVLIMVPFLDPTVDEDDQLPTAEMVAALMEAVELVKSRPITPGQPYFGYRLAWVDRPAPVVVSEPAPEPTLAEALTTLVDQHGIKMGQFHLRDGVVVRNTLRSS